MWSRWPRSAGSPRPGTTSISVCSSIRNEGKITSPRRHSSTRSPASPAWRPYQSSVRSTSPTTSTRWSSPRAALIGSLNPGDDLPVDHREGGAGIRGPGPPAGGDGGELVPGGDAIVPGLGRKAGGGAALGPHLRPPRPVLGGGEGPGRGGESHIAEARFLSPGEQVATGRGLSAVAAGDGLVHRHPAVQPLVGRRPEHG